MNKKNGVHVEKSVIINTANLCKTLSISLFDFMVTLSARIWYSIAPNLSEKLARGE